MPISVMYGQPSCRAVPEALGLAASNQVGRRFTSPCVLRSIRDRGSWGVVFPTVRVAYRLWCLSSASSGPRAISRAFVRNRPRPTRAPGLVKVRGLLGRGHLCSGGSRPLERPRVSELCNRSSLSRAETLRIGGRDHDTRSHTAVMLLLSSRPVDLAVGRPVFSLRRSRKSSSHRVMRNPMQKDGKSPSRVASSSAIGALASPKTPASDARTPAGKPSESRGCPPTVRRRGT